MYWQKFSSRPSRRNRQHCTRKSWLALEPTFRSNCPLGPNGDHAPDERKEEDKSGSDTVTAVQYKENNQNKVRWTEINKVGPMMIISWIQTSKTTSIVLHSTLTTVRDFGHTCQFSSNVGWTFRLHWHGQTKHGADYTWRMPYHFRSVSCCTWISECINLQNASHESYRGCRGRMGIGNSTWPEKEGRLQLGMEYRKRSGVAVKDAYPAFEMPACLDFIGEVRIFLT